MHEDIINLIQLFFFSRKEGKLLQAARIGMSFAKERCREIEIGILLETFEAGQVRRGITIMQG